MNKQKPNRFLPSLVPRWIEQINYSGDDFSQYYVASWRFFRCSPVERSNHAYIRDHLLDVGAVEGQVITPTFTDEVMGARYYVMVRDDFERGLRMAEMFAKRIAAKGSLDPASEAAIDQKSIRHTWNSSTMLSKILMCSEAGISLFSARSPKFPERHADALYAALGEA